jgi:hypothetical protein
MLTEFRDFIILQISGESSLLSSQQKENPMSALAFNLDNMSLSELNVTIEELTKIKAFKVEKQNLEEYLSFLPKDVVETVIKEKYSYLFPESVVQL